MTIDEAIESLKSDYEIDMYIRDIAPQIAEWLEELQLYKKGNYTERLVNAVAKTLVEAFENLTIEDVNMYQLGYNKAIDDFAELMKELVRGHMYVNDEYGTTIEEMLSSVAKMEGYHEIDLEKVHTVEDAMLIVKLILKHLGHGEIPELMMCDDYDEFDKYKHLMK